MKNWNGLLRSSEGAQARVFCRALEVEKGMYTPSFWQLKKVRPSQFTYISKPVSLLLFRAMKLRVHVAIAQHFYSDESMVTRNFLVCRHISWIFPTLLENCDLHAIDLLLLLKVSLLSLQCHRFTRLDEVMSHLEQLTRTCLTPTAAAPKHTEPKK